MAILGGGVGGAGNPVGGSFTGPAEALEIIGDHCFAYGGISTAVNTPGTNYLSFTSGNYYAVVNVQCYNTVDDSSKINWEFELNGTKIFEYTQEGRAASIGIHMGEGNAMIISPYTEVIVRGISTGTEVAGAVVLTGRIYRTRD